MKKVNLPPILAALLVCSCFPPKPDPALDSWQSMLSSYARHYDGIMGAADHLRVVPSRGFEFPVGTALRPDSASSITNVCVWTQAIPELAMTPTPLITTGRQFVLSANLPDAIKAALGAVLGVSASFSGGGTTAVSFQNEKGFLLTEQQIAAILREPHCAEALFGTSFQIVRGYISAQQVSESKAGIDAELSLTVEQVGLTVKYNDNKDWSVKDTSPHQYFLIISSVAVSSRSTSSAPNSVSSVLSGPGDMETGFSLSKPTDAELMGVGLAP